MKKVLAMLTALIMLCGCSVLPASVDPEDIRLNLNFKESDKTTAEFDISISNKGAKPKSYGWVVYDLSGAPLKNGQSHSPTFKVEGLNPGTCYIAEGWADFGGDRLVTTTLPFETEFRFSGAIAKGIDVSRWQNDINWTAVAGDGIEFAIMRIGYSNGFDRNFEKYYQGAKDAGLEIGVYLYSYATDKKQAIKDAKDIIKKLDGKNLDYPIYYDIEDDCQNFLTRDELTEIAIAFCDEIEKSGYEAGVYASKYTFLDRLDESLLSEKYDLWMAEVSGSAPTSTNYHMVQYSHTGRVKGIKGNVDLNCSFAK